MLSYDYVGPLIIIVVFNCLAIWKIKKRINVLIDHINKLEEELNLIKQIGTK